MRDSSSSEVQWFSNAGRPSAAGSRYSNPSGARRLIWGFQHSHDPGRGVARVGEAGSPALGHAPHSAVPNAAPVFMTVARTSKAPNFRFERSGRERMVRAFSVTSSPRAVAARHRPAPAGPRVLRRHESPSIFQFDRVAGIRPSQQFAHAGVECAARLRSGHFRRALGSCAGL